MKAFLSSISKTIASMIGAALLWAGPVVKAGHVTSWDWYLLAVALAGVLGVYGVTNVSRPAPTTVAEPAAKVTGK